MKRLVNIILIVFLLSAPIFSQTKNLQKKSVYLPILEHFANTLLDKGLDTYGVRNTKMWASVMDTRDLSVPMDSVPATQGIRDIDRAIGGSNLYHDVNTIRVFRVLSAITGNPRYNKAVNDYLKDFLQNNQNPETGLLGWGEHLYYDFKLDRVEIAPSARNGPGFGMYHEFEAATPPFDALWAIDSARTIRAIEGLQYHFADCIGGTFLFSRHARWDKPIYVNSIMPWIKHSGLYAYSYSFLFSKTNNNVVLRKAIGSGSLYWSQRNRNTNLVESCIFHGSEGAGKTANPNQTAYLAYWLYKAWQLNPKIKVFQNISLSLWKGIDQYAWDDQAKNYINDLNLDGSPTVIFPGPDGVRNSKYSAVWNFGYGTGSICDYARMAAFMYKASQDTVFRTIVQRTVTIANNSPFPKTATAENYAQAINLNLDAYDVTGNRVYLDKAKEFVDLAIHDLYKNGLFTRQAGDPYYEAKLGIGSMIAGIMRLHLYITGQNTLIKETDWTI